MTRFDPSILIKRLVVFRNNTTVYDANFHAGVNIIRGANSSGKSTILNFLYYGLGGDLAEWSGAAQLCSRVILEVELSGNTATLSREVSTQIGAPMEIFSGSYEAAQLAPRDDWKRYPYRRSQSQESFSQTIFRLLGIPDVAVELSGNITVHQMLRLLYADQLSPVEDLFRFERFEQNNLRDTVGRLLCGAYVSRLYENEQKIKVLTKEFDAAQAELSSLFAILGRTDQSINLDWITAQRAVIEQKKRILETSIEAAERLLFTRADADQISMQSQDALYSETQKLQAEIYSIKVEQDTLLLTIADSDIFISSLKQKIDTLKDTAAVAEHIGDVRFHSCPACYAVIDEPSSGGDYACHLCKTPFDTERMKNRIAGLISETAIQIKQSEILQKRRQERASALRGQLSSLENTWKSVSEKLVSAQRLPSSEARQSLREMHRQAGYLEREGEDLSEKARLIQLAAELSDTKSRLNLQITALKTENEGLRASQQNRLANAYTAISSEIRSLLRSDLRRQDSFIDAKSVNFTFSENKIFVDGQSYFSASSRAILKSSFCLGFMAAAAKIEFFRHPRFCMIDTLENMGVEAIRSQNFQNQIALLSSSLTVTHQIIYATAMIAPDLDDARYTVGKYSTLDEPTIAVKVGS